MLEENDLQYWIDFIKFQNQKFLENIFGKVIHQKQKLEDYGIKD